MKIINETVYDWKAILAMNRVVTRGTRRAESRRLRMLSSAIALVLCWLGWRMQPGLPATLVGIAGALLLAWVILLNYIRAFIMEKLILKGAHRYTNTFEEEGWSVAASNGEEQMLAYSAVTGIFENERYLILMTGERQGYILDKQGFAGCADGFRTLIEEKTGKTIQKV